MVYPFRRGWGRRLYGSHLMRLIAAGPQAQWQMYHWANAGDYTIVRLGVKIPF